MNVAPILKSCIGKVLKTIREDAKAGTTTLEFEDGVLNTKVTLQMKGTTFVSSSTTAVKKPKPSLKAKEQALEPAGLVKPSKKRKRPTKTNLTTM